MKFDLLQIIGAALVVVGGQGAIRLLIDHDDTGLLGGLGAPFTVNLVTYLTATLFGVILAGWAHDRAKALGRREAAARPPGMIVPMGSPDPRPLRRLATAHARAPFPPRLRGVEIEGEDMVELDACIAGCVSTLLSDPPAAHQHALRLACLAAVEKVLPFVEDAADALAYCTRLRDMAAMAVQLASVPESGARHSS